MHPHRFILLPFLGISCAAHLVLLMYPAAPPAPPAAVHGDAGLQVTLVRRVDATPAAAPAPAGNARPQPVTTRARTAPAPRPQPAQARATQPAQPAAATAQAASAPAQESRSAPGTPLLASLRNAIQPHFHYPLLARRRGWEGTVRIGLHISANGEISRLHIVETSRHPILDQAAIDCLSRLRQMPEAIAWLDGHDSDIVLPVEYRLTDG